MGFSDLFTRARAVFEKAADSQLEVRLTDVDITDRPDNGTELDRAGNVDKSIEGRNYYVIVKDWGQEIALGAKDIDQDGKLDVVYERNGDKLYYPGDRYFEKVQGVVRDFEKALPGHIRYAQSLVKGELPDTVVRTEPSGATGHEDVRVKTVETNSYDYSDLQLNRYYGTGPILRMEDGNGNGCADSVEFRTPDGQTRIVISHPEWNRMDFNAPLLSARIYLFSLGPV
jgi:hypothetical protein